MTSLRTTRRARWAASSFTLLLAVVSTFLVVGAYRGHTDATGPVLAPNQRPALSQPAQLRRNGSADRGHRPILGPPLGTVPARIALAALVAVAVAVAALADGSGRRRPLADVARGPPAAR
jgi:hypothetical protein